MWRNIGLRWSNNVQKTITPLSDPGSISKCAFFDILYYTDPVLQGHQDKSGNALRTICNSYETKSSFSHTVDIE